MDNRGARSGVDGAKKAAAVDAKVATRVSFIMVKSLFVVVVRSVIDYRASRSSTEYPRRSIYICCA